MNEEQRMAEVKKFKNHFLHIYRPGADKLLAWLEEAGFSQRQQAQSTTEHTQVVWWNIQTMYTAD